MEIVTGTYAITPYRTASYHEYFNGLSVAIFDIETTGLYPQNNQLILGGILNLSDSHVEVSQYFARQKNDEKELLYEYGRALARADVLISYNGNGFDLPFLKQRFLTHGVPEDLSSVQSLDLYRAIRNHSPLRAFLPDLKQKTVENYLGIQDQRADRIDGAESVRLYEDFIGTGSPSSREKILLHNRDDLLQLLSLLKVLDKLDLHRILHHEGLTAARMEKRCVVRSVSFRKSKLEVEARTKNITMDYYSFDPSYQAIHLASEHKMTLEIPLEKVADAMVLDLTAFSLDFSSLEKYPGCQNGYLILMDKGILNYAEVNLLIRIFLTEIMGLI